MSEQDVKAAGVRGVAIDKHTDAWNKAYQEAYALIPYEYKGGMLSEAINSLTGQDIVDDIIVSAYFLDDREAATTALFLLLDSWRKRKAESIANEATGE